jgi:LysM repeat protein
MKKQLSKLRRFFARTGARKLDATATREAIPVSYDDDDGSTRLSGAFVIVLLLHVVALVGVFTYSRMRENSATTSSSEAAAKAGKTNAATAANSAPAAQPPATSVAAATPLPAAQADAAPIVDLPPIPPLATRLDRRHIVKAGETLTRIAISYSITRTDLASANGIKNEDELRTGQELTIPPAKTVKTEPKPPAPVKVSGGTYTVRKGDTLAKIANTLGVKYNDLAKANSIKDPKKLQEGQKLKVPGK